MLLQPHQFIGDVQGSEHGHAQRINGIAVGGDGAHLGVHGVGQPLNVFRIGSPQMIRLVVDIYTDRGAGVPDFHVICHVSPMVPPINRLDPASVALIQRSIAQFVNLLEQTLDAHAHCVPFLLQAGELLF
jgi:hypothetical protein